MSMLNEVLGEIFVGGDENCQIDDPRRFIQMFGQFMEDFQSLAQELSDQSEEEGFMMEEESEEAPETGQQTMMNEPNQELNIPLNMTLQAYLQANPDRRTLLKQIATRAGSMVSGPTISSNRQTQLSKVYPIYRFTDLAYAPSERVKGIYDRLIHESLYKHRKFKKFDQDYYDSLLNNFSVFNEAEMREYINQSRDSELIYSQLKDKTTIKALETQLTKYTQLQNETKDQFTILAQQQRTFNPYDQFQEDQCNPLNTVSFYKDIDHIINRKKVKMEQPQKYEVGQSHIDYENAIRKHDRITVSKFFTKKYQLFEHSFYNDEYEYKMFDQSFRQQKPIQNQSTYKYWGEPDEAGFAIHDRIQQQLEHDRKQIEQPLPKEAEPPAEPPKLTQSEQAFEQAIQNYSYYNQNIMDFCLGKKDHFLNKPFQEYNRVEIDLNNKQFFSEKLEIILHQQKPKEKPLQISQLKGGAPSLQSKPIDQRSLQTGLLLSLDDNQNESQSDFSQEEPFNNQLGQDIADDFLNKELCTLVEQQLKNKINSPPIYNSQVAEGFLLNNFSQDIEKHQLYHRSNIIDILYAWKLLHLGLERRSVRHFDPWDINLVGTKSIQTLKDNREIVFDEYPEKLNSQEFYKTIPKLSLVKGNFVLLEYIEQRPIILNDPGMCIKATRFVYGHRALQQFSHRNREDQSIAEFKKTLVDRLGKIGKIKFLDRKESISLQGQLVDEKILGITVIENDLYRAPIFKQKMPETDFILVRQCIDDVHFKYALRPVDCIYLVGQIEPKMEIFTPHSRPLGTFLKNCLKTVIKKSFRDHKQIKQDELEAIFPKQSHQNIRSALKDCMGVQDTMNQKTWNYQSLDESFLKFDITANDVCKYESMLHSSYLLYEFGLRELKNSDKMKKTLQEFLTRHPNDYEDWVIARRIEDELNMTSWSLSSSFVHSADQTGRMLLYGLGDPTSGYGGLSYIKKPLKARGEKGENAIQEKRQQVMGTDNDLRKLHVSDIKKILLTLGKTPEQVANLKRWKMINLVTTFIQQAQNPEDQHSVMAITFKKNLELLTAKEKRQLEVIEKFAKNQRLTTKKQKEQYQKELDTQLNYLIHNLTLTVHSNHFEDFAQIKKMRIQRKLPNDDKNKDLEYSQQDIEPFLIAYKDRYKLQLKAYLLKERKIWLDKKRKKGLV